MKARLKTSRQQKTHNRLFLNGRRAALVVAGLVIGLGLVLPQDSLASRKHHRVKVQAGQGHRGYRRAPVSHYGGRGQVSVRAGYFTAPRRIVVGAGVNRYRPYYSRRAYYAPHRHHHNVYNFPVYSQQRRVFRPYAYCNGNLYGGPRLSYSRPGFNVAVGW